MNNIFLSGNLVKEPELKNGANNTKWLSNTIAVKRTFKNPQGEYESDFINFMAFKFNAEFIAKNCHKGTQLVISGRLQISNYTSQDGTTKYSTDVVVDNVVALKQTTQQAAQNNAPAFDMPGTPDYTGASIPTNSDEPF